MPIITKKILETPQKETLPPKKSSYHGQVNHRTKKETKLKKELLSRQKALNPGKKRAQLSKPKPKLQRPTSKKQKPQKLVLKTTKKRTPKPGQGPKVKTLQQQQARNPYEQLLAQASQHMNQQLNQGYQDYIEDKMEEAQAIDINTSEYRFIGYFTTMRKAIELVWRYPKQAALKGQHGRVGMKFTIHKDGHISNVSVISSSGYKVLDYSIANAIELAAPFSPLPNGFGKNKLVITGTFSYLLR